MVDVVNSKKARTIGWKYTKYYDAIISRMTCSYTSKNSKIIKNISNRTKREKKFKFVLIKTMSD